MFVFVFRGADIVKNGRCVKNADKRHTNSGCRLFGNGRILFFVSVQEQQKSVPLSVCIIPAVYGTFADVGRAYRRNKLYSQYVPFLLFRQ